MKFVWENIIINFYRERYENPETNVVVAVKAKRLKVSKFKKDTELTGTIYDFIPLRGDLNYVSSDEGLSDRYVLCWLDNEKNDLHKTWRGKINGVTFSKGILFTTDTDGKRIYNATFNAEY